MQWSPDAAVTVEKIIMCYSLTVCVCVCAYSFNIMYGSDRRIIGTTVYIFIGYTLVNTQYVYMQRL